MLKLLAKVAATALLLSSFTVATPSQAQGLFSLPNFIGDTREEDCHYNTLHQYPFPAWDTYQLLLQSYAAEARAAGSRGFPNPPYSTYNYAAGVMNVGPGGPVPSPAGESGTIVDGSSGITVNPNGGGITGVAAATTGGAMTATTTVTGTVLSPAQFNSAPGLAP